MMKVYTNFDVFMLCTYILGHFTNVRWHCNCTDYPRISSSYPHISSSYPQVILTYPHISSSYPHISSSYPHVDVHDTACYQHISSSDPHISTHILIISSSYTSSVVLMSLPIGPLPRGALLRGLSHQTHASTRTLFFSHSGCHVSPHISRACSCSNS
jgi:hypothetical protein